MPARGVLWLQLASNALDHLLTRPNATLARPETDAFLPQGSGELKLLFLHPKTLIDSWPAPVDTLGEIIKAPSAVYPVLASVVSDLRVQMEIFDGYVTRESFANYKRRLQQADVIAISMMSPLKALDTELTIRLAKVLNPDVKIVLGGNHASAFPERWIDRGADFVIVGEGEVAFRKLIEAMLSQCRKYDDVPNLVYRSNGHIKPTGIKAPKIDLNLAPLPRWDLVDLRPYALGLGTNGLTAAVEVSRGCPHRCDFCNINTFWHYRQDYKSVARVCDELEQLRRLGVEEFIFTDDNFAQDHRHTRKLFEEMVRRNLNMRFGSFMRGDTVNRHPELIDLAARAGLSFCLMGIETLNPEWLKSHRKGVRADDIVAMYKHVYRVLRRNGVLVIGLFITAPEAERNQVSGRGADGVVCDVHYSADLVALKGSALFDNLIESGTVGKDMFYHDWNLPSIKLGDGRTQISRRSFGSLWGSWNSRAILDALIGSPLAKQFRWRNVGVMVERILCTTRADVRRYRIAKDTTVPLEIRQQNMIETVITPQYVVKLIKARHFKSPLSLRNSIWSARPVGQGRKWPEATRLAGGDIRSQRDERDRDIKIGPDLVDHALSPGSDERDQSRDELGLMGRVAHL